MKSITLLWRSVWAGYETVPSGVLSSNFENAFKMCKRERTNSKLFIFFSHSSSRKELRCNREPKSTKLSSYRVVFFYLGYQNLGIYSVHLWLHSLHFYLTCERSWEETQISRKSNLELPTVVTVCE